MDLTTHEHGEGEHGAGEHGAGATAPTDAGWSALVDVSRTTEDRWETFYRERGMNWSGRPNALLVEVAGPLSPGRALDLGCGEGGDAVWLASRGWATTAVDVAPTALARTREAAAAAGVEVATEQHDLAESLPDGPFDLVSACFLQSPVEWDRPAVLRRAAAAVAPGGTLLVVDHGSAPPWSWHGTVAFPTAFEVHASLELPEQEWDVVRLDAPEREATGPDGRTAVVTDLVVAVRRRA